MLTLTRPTTVLTSSTSATAVGGRLFRKEVLRVGSWVHPDTGERIAFGKEDLAAIANATNTFIGVQGPVPFPNGHTFSALENLGFWRHFFVEGDRLFGVVEAGTDEIAGKLGATIRDVSVFLESTVRDSKGGEHHGVISHCCATGYPVITNQSNFVALAREGKEERVPVYRPEKGKTMHEGLTKVAGALGVVTDGQDEAKLVAALEAKVKELAAAQETSTQAKALAAKNEEAALAAKSEATALSARLAALEKEMDARDQAECDGEVRAVKELAAKHGRPEALDPAREKCVRDRWSKDREVARQMLALAREIATATPAIGGMVVVKPADKEAQALARRDAVETAQREARALGWSTRECDGKLLATRPGEKREIVLVG